MGQLVGMLKSAATDRDVANAATFERLGGFLTDVAAAEQEHAALLEFAEYAAGQIDGDVADANLPASDASLRAGGFGCVEAFFK